MFLHFKPVPIASFNHNSIIFVGYLYITNAGYDAKNNCVLRTKYRVLSRAVLATHDSILSLDIVQDV
jgi:hypothetical protein